MSSNFEAPDSIQQDILIGSLLGDGYICKDKRSLCCHFAKKQSTVDRDGHDKKGFLQWHADNLPSFSCKINSYKTKKGFSGYTLSVSRQDYLRELERIWYVAPANPGSKRKKVLPKDLILSPLSLAVWYMDDGTHEPKSRRVKLCSQSFTKEENEFLCFRLREDLGIEAGVQASLKKFLISTRVESYLKFMEVIKPHCTWSCFHYKYDSTNFNKPIVVRGELNGRSKFSKSQAIDIIKRYRRGGITQEQLAKEYGVRNNTISRVVNGQRWNYLQEVVNAEN